MCTRAGPVPRLFPPVPSLTLSAAVVPQVGVHGRACGREHPLLRSIRPAVLLRLTTAWPSSEDWTLRSSYGRQEPLTAAQKVSLDATLAASYAPRVLRRAPVLLPSP